MSDKFEFTSELICDTIAICIVLGLNYVMTYHFGTVLVYGIQFVANIFGL